jgi:hypothetical protein
MTEPNRDDLSNFKDHLSDNLINQRPRPWKYDDTIPHPGTFGNASCRVPEISANLRPVPDLWQSLRLLVDDHHGVRWVVDVAEHGRSATLRKTDENLRFQLSVDVTREDTSYATLVRHPVDDPALADCIEDFILSGPFHQSGHVNIPLRVGCGHDIDPCDPLALHNFELSVLVRWNPPPGRAEEHRIAQFFLWNVDVLLWIRNQATFNLRNR